MPYIYEKRYSGSDGLTRRISNLNRSSDFYDNDLMNMYALNWESAKKQMDFQDYMSSTAHQREVADLQAAGLNPILAVNNGAPAAAGAYTTIDNSAIAAKNAQRLQDQQIKAQLFMNQYNTDKNYQLGIAQAGISAGAVVAAAQANAAASMYGSDVMAAASKYGSDIGLTNAREQREYDNLHPTNGYQAAGSAIYSLIDAFKNPGIRYNPGSSTAK